MDIMPPLMNGDNNVTRKKDADKESKENLWYVKCNFQYFVVKK
jgi:hypothetical protein